MTPNQAFDLLTQVCSAFRGTLQEHQALQKALEVLKPKEEPKAE